MTGDRTVHPGSGSGSVGVTAWADVRTSPGKIYAVTVTTTSSSGDLAPSTPSASGRAAPGVTPGDSGARAEFAIGGMHCEACVALIEESLTEQPGVAAASVDLGSARAVVHYDASVVGTQDLCATIAEAGYSATVAG